MSSSSQIPARPRRGGALVPLRHARGGSDNYAFDSAAGRPILMLFFGSAASPAAAAALAAMQERRDLFDDDHAAFFGITVDPGRRRRGPHPQAHPRHPLLPRLRPGGEPGLWRRRRAVVDRLSAAIGCCSTGRSGYAAASRSTKARRRSTRSRARRRAARARLGAGRRGPRRLRARPLPPADRPLRGRRRRGIGLHARRRRHDQIAARSAPQGPPRLSGRGSGAGAAAQPAHHPPAAADGQAAPSSIEATRVERLLVGCYEAETRRPFPRPSRRHVEGHGAPPLRGDDQPQCRGI